MSIDAHGLHGLNHSLPCLTVSATLALLLGGVEVQAQKTGRPVELPAISVTANRVATPTTETGSTLTIVTGEELERRQTQILSDVLREVPGLAINRTGPMGGLSRLRIRGSEGNQTLGHRQLAESRSSADVGQP
jgi:vitamin B12 transporter